MRKYLLLFVVFLVLYIASSIALQYYRFQKIPPWKRALNGLPGVEVVENSPFSASFQQNSNRISHDLILVDNWSKDEVDELLGFIDIPLIDDDQVTDTELFDINLLEIWMGKNDALFAISERFRVGAPVDEDQRERLIDALVGDLYQDKSSLDFQFAASNAIHSGLASTPGPIRDRILYIYTHPLEFFGNDGLGVAENIKRQLKARGVFILEGETHQ